MAQIVLEATVRAERGKHVGALRRQGRVPTIVYGHGREPMALSTDLRQLERVWMRAGRTHLVDLTIDGHKAEKVIIRDFQIDPRSARAIHADLYVVNLKEKLTADVPLVCIGEAPAVADLKIGQLQQVMSSIKVECLPQDLPAQISVDVTGLAELDAGIHVRDLELPAGVVVFGMDAEELVVKIAAIRVQQEEAPVAAAEEAAPAEGAAPEESSPAS